MAPAVTANVDFNAIKQRQHAMWASGDYAVVGRTLQIVGELLAEAVDLRAGERVLDVAAGHGNASLAAARRHARVTSTDYVAHWLAQGASRAKAEGLQIDFVEADAEALPFDSRSFDVVLSTFGAMYTPQHEKAASELQRVIRSGGRIGMANWTPEGFVGQYLRLISDYVQPPAGTQPAALWGAEPHITRLFGAQARYLRCLRRHFHFRYQSAAH